MPLNSMVKPMPLPPPAFSSQTYLFDVQGQRIIAVNRELVQTLDARGNFRLDVRETLSLTPEYEAYLQSLGL